MIMSIHKNLTDEHDIVRMANLFIADHPHRQDVFGLFKPSDLHMAE